MVVGRVVVVVGRVVVVVGRVVVVVGRLVVARRLVEVDVVVAEPDRMLAPQSEEHAVSPSRADRATPTGIKRANAVVSLDMARFSPIGVIQFPAARFSRESCVQTYAHQSSGVPPYTAWDGARLEKPSWAVHPCAPGQGRNSILGRHCRGTAALGGHQAGSCGTSPGPQ